MADAWRKLFSRVVLSSLAWRSHCNSFPATSSARVGARYRSQTIYKDESTRMVHAVEKGYWFALYMYIQWPMMHPCMSENM